MWVKIHKLKKNKKLLVMLVTDLLSRSFFCCTFLRLVKGLVFWSDTDLFHEHRI